MTTSKEFAALLKEAHSKSGLTNKEFAAKLKTSTAVIWRWEKELHVPTIIKAIPNFDKAIFKEITGIDVDEDNAK